MKSDFGSVSENEVHIYLERGLMENKRERRELGKLKEDLEKRVLRLVGQEAELRERCQE